MNLRLRRELGVNPSDTPEVAHTQDVAAVEGSSRGSTVSPTESDVPEGHELGRFGRLLVLPFIPLVAFWEGLAAAGRGTVASVRWVGVHAARTIARLAARVTASFRWVGSSLGSLARAFGRRLRTLGLFVSRPIRVASRTVVALLCRAWVALRAAARAVAVPVRDLGRFVVAVLRRWGLAVRAVAKAAAAASRTGWRGLVAVVRRVRGGLRAGARAIAAPVRGAGRATRALLVRWGVVLSAVARRIARPLRAAGRAVGAALHRLGSALRAIGDALFESLRTAGRGAARVMAWIAAINRSAGRLLGSVVHRVRTAVGRARVAVVGLARGVARRTMAAVDAGFRWATAPIRSATRFAVIQLRRAQRPLDASARVIARFVGSAMGVLAGGGAAALRLIAVPFLAAGVLARRTGHWVLSVSVASGRAGARLLGQLWRPADRSLGLARAAAEWTMRRVATMASSAERATAAQRSSVRSAVAGGRQRGRRQLQEIRASVRRSTASLRRRQPPLVHQAGRPAVGVTLDKDQPVLASEAVDADGSLGPVASPMQP